MVLDTLDQPRIWRLGLLSTIVGEIFLHEIKVRGTFFIRNHSQPSYWRESVRNFLRAVVGEKY